MTGILILSNWEDGGTSDHLFFFFQEMKEYIMHRNSSQKSACLCQFPIPLSPPGWQSWPIRICTEWRGVQGHRPHKQQTSHPPSLPSPRTWAVTGSHTVCTLTYLVAYMTSYRNFSASEDRSTYRLATQQEFSRLLWTHFGRVLEWDPARIFKTALRGPCPSQHHFVEVHAYDQF